ncbi:hypothetical protein [Cryobacterium serini]|uniref:Uncharacterized protein n=1 Tax=Cryobacterium serini TaxID=1259201 RepID=A0A4R9BRY3_9MICO|nr:hypothetical protein [Cryobacterium serini]TFD89804.1 hypothetical protein E3T51_03535 [Cryobacterium serini]
MTHYGRNHAQVLAYLRQLSTLTNEQWKAVRTEAIKTRQPRNQVWYGEVEVVDRMGRRAEWEAAHEAAVAAFNKAYPLTTIQGSWRNYRMEPAQGGAGDAARAIVIGDLITDKALETLTAPMRAAGVSFRAPSR